ncbi:putative membrane protein [Inhella inkyongensis]|uniref:Putative membrane protein n=1 Tax=Inhella inkyongensis TaxID=392593 RepID=A0A840S990_9BURK|nr:urate hydroxylase PuuD [Inhella inkyongensis]MBB5205354.1 putative membrane protein [Inhella inkyongensis]
MDLGYLADWANLLLRWAHVITAIAWIGSSFYFVFLDSSLTRPTDADLKAKGVDGELWAVHGGGFYHPQKYLVAPKALPEKLHWFFWESYSTWLTGFALFTVLYLFNAQTFLIDPKVYAWGSSGAAVGAALGLLLAFWFVYDGVCRLLGEKDGKVGGDARVGLVLLAVVALSSWAACQLFAGRAAFVLVGAMMATAMSANVLVWIIPGQRKVIAQMKAGEPVSPIHGQRGKQRSVHNTYFTLPVLIAMLSNHYGFLYQGAYNWVLLFVLMLAGALIRHSFVARHKALIAGKSAPWGWALAGVVLIAGLVLIQAPKPPVAAPAQTQPQAQAVSRAQVQAVLNQRCVLCHSEAVQNKGVALHTDALLTQHALAVYQQAVVARSMPLNNATQMSDEERDLIKRWFEAGAK